MGTRTGSAAVATLVFSAGAVMAACGGDRDETYVTLPPMRTTTTDATTTTVADDTRIFYTVKPGESLSIIAESFGVPLPALIEINGIANPNSVAAGSTLEIPTDVRLVDQLPTPAGQP
jgi:LysM repeat protein